MSSSFVFDPPSDEEIDNSEPENDEQGQEPNDDEGADEPRLKNSGQSPWDFASYSESVAEEHARRSTTSIDDKITKAIQRRSDQPSNAVEEDDGDDEESGGSDSEPDRQVTISTFCFFETLGDLNIRFSKFTSVLGFLGRLQTRGRR